MRILSCSAQRGGPDGLASVSVGGTVRERAGTDLSPLVVGMSSMDEL